MDYNRVSKLIGEDGKVLRANYYIGDRLIRTESFRAAHPKGAKGAIQQGNITRTLSTTERKKVQAVMDHLMANAKDPTAVAKWASGFKSGKELLCAIEALERESENRGVPEMPKMRWNADGSPDFSHLRTGGRGPQPSTAKKMKTGVPPMPVMRWNRDGTPDFRHLREGRK